MRPSCYNKTMAVKQIILVVLIVMLGVGCANTEDGMPEEKHEDEPTMPQIAVSASVAASEGASRATPIMSKTDLSALEISVKRNDTDQDYFVDVATPLGNVFSFSTPHYWLPGAPLDFYAYTPSPHLSNLSVGKGTIKFDYTAAVAGVATFVAGCSGFDLQDIGTYNIAGVGSDLSAIEKLSAIFFNFIHSVRPPDILL